MLERISEKTSDFLIRRGIVSRDSRDVYVYGFALLYSFLINTVVIMSAGIILGKVIETLMFLFIFVVLRSFTGGFHSNSFVLCTVITYSVYTAVMLLSTFRVHLVLFGILFVGGFVCLFLVAPIEHPNKPISDKKKRQHKITSLVLFSFIAVAGIVINIYDMSYGSVIFFSLIADIVLLFIKNSKKGVTKDV